MRYSVEIEINLPGAKVVELFMDSEKYPKWMEGLESYVVLEGEYGKEGAKAKYHFKTGKREITMIEKIIENKLPEKIVVSYTAKGVYNIAESRFEKVGADKTLYTSEQEFRFKGFMKMLGWFMPGAFKKQTLENLKAFKTFAEAEVNK